MDSGLGTNSKSPYQNNQQGQMMNEGESIGGSNNSNLQNNSSSTNATNQQQGDFNLDDLNFDPAALIGGNGENTDLNVSWKNCWNRNIPTKLFNIQYDAINTNVGVFQ